MGQQTHPANPEETLEKIENTLWKSLKNSDSRQSALVQIAAMEKKFPESKLVKLWNTASNALCVQDSNKREAAWKKIKMMVEELPNDKLGSVLWNIAAFVLTNQDSSVRKGGLSALSTLIEQFPAEAGNTLFNIATFVLPYQNSSVQQDGMDAFNEIIEKFGATAQDALDTIPAIILDNQNFSIRQNGLEAVTKLIEKFPEKVSGVMFSIASYIRVSWKPEIVSDALDTITKLAEKFPNEFDVREALRLIVSNVLVSRDSGVRDKAMTAIETLVAKFPENVTFVLLDVPFVVLTSHDSGVRRHGLTVFTRLLKEYPNKAVIANSLHTSLASLNSDVRKDALTAVITLVETYSDEAQSVISSISSVILTSPNSDVLQNGLLAITELMKVVPQHANFAFDEVLKLDFDHICHFCDLMGGVVFSYLPLPEDFVYDSYIKLKGFCDENSHDVSIALGKLMQKFPVSTLIDFFFQSTDNVFVSFITDKILSGVLTFSGEMKDKHLSLSFLNGFDERSWYHQDTEKLLSLIKAHIHNRYPLTKFVFCSFDVSGSRSSLLSRIGWI